MRCSDVSCVFVSAVEIFPLYNMSTILNREEYCKPQPKKPKERATERPSLSQVSTPPSSSYKSGPACNATPNGYGKSHGTAASGGGGGGSPGNKRAERRTRGSPKHSDSDPQGENPLIGAASPRISATSSALDASGHCFNTHLCIIKIL